MEIQVTTKKGLNLTVSVNEDGWYDEELFLARITWTVFQVKCLNYLEGKGTILKIHDREDFTKIGKIIGIEGPVAGFDLNKESAERLQFATLNMREKMVLDKKRSFYAEQIKEAETTKKNVLVKRARHSVRGGEVDVYTYVTPSGDFETREIGLY